MIDTHAHLDFPEFEEDCEEVISRAFDNGVKKIVNIGVDLERSRRSVEIARNNENIFASVGLHPDYFSKAEKIPNPEFENVIGKLRELAKDKKVVAIGETGLDYYYITRNAQRATQEELENIKKNQKKGFLRQIEIAKELNLPVIVHCRDAWRDLYKIISNFKPARIASRNEAGGFQISNFQLHCYSGDKNDTEKFLKLPNVYFSFSGNITYPKPKKKHDKLVEAIQEIPLDKIMLDSDSPFLAPQEMRGKRNEPINILYIAKKIAEIKKINKKEIERKTDENAEKFFRISLKNKN